MSVLRDASGARRVPRRIGRKTAPIPSRSAHHAFARERVVPSLRRVRVFAVGTGVAIPGVMKTSWTFPFFWMLSGCAAADPDARSVTDASVDVDEATASDGQIESAAPSKGTGGSLAKCTPSPCTTGTTVTHTANVDDGAGKIVSRTYMIYRPKNLTNTPTNKAPLVVLFAPGMTNSTWQTVADQNAIVLALVPNWYATGYFAPVTNPHMPPVIYQCGPSGTGRCDDKPFVVGVLDDVIGGVQDQNIDPNRVFGTGCSKGGFFSEEMFCAPSISSRFRGVSIRSAYFMGATQNVQSSAPNCPTTNRDISVRVAVGTADSAIPIVTSQGANQLDAQGYWIYGEPEGGDWLAPWLGCTQGGAATAFGSPSAANTRYTWTSCAMPYRAAEVVLVGGAPHCAIDGYNGYDEAAEAWAFFSAH
jgi:poly(3-hydroxybutyrate) depolymerase